MVITEYLIQIYILFIVHHVCSGRFWTSQAGVKGYHVYADKLVSWPERTIMIELQDLASLQRIIDSAEHKRLRREFMANIARAESQIQDVIV